MSRALPYNAEQNYSSYSKDIKAGYKIWLEKNDAVFGDGLFELLCLISENGSISKAAEKMDMSYRAAWGKIKYFEKQWGESLVLTRVGGETGGGAVLTEDAQKLIESFECFKRNVEVEVHKFFNKCFK